MVDAISGPAAARADRAPLLSRLFTAVRLYLRTRRRDYAQLLRWKEPPMTPGPVFPVMLAKANQQWTTPEARLLAWTTFETACWLSAYRNGLGFPYLPEDVQKALFARSEAAPAETKTA